MCSILLLSLVARCLETIDVCIWRMFVFSKRVLVSINRNQYIKVISVCMFYQLT